MGSRLEKTCNLLKLCGNKKPDREYARSGSELSPSLMEKKLLWGAGPIACSRRFDKKISLQPATRQAKNCSCICARFLSLIIINFVATHHITSFF
jgi:hypothetical protein